MPSSAARVIYPELPHPITRDDLQRLFTPSYAERLWAPTIASTASSQVALLVQLKVFQTIGRFVQAADIPSVVVEHVARRLGVDLGAAPAFADRTLYRHRSVIRHHLGVIPWGPKGRAIAVEAMRKSARVRTDPADIVNAAIDALVRHQVELPLVSALRRLAGTAYTQINTLQYKAVGSPLSTRQRSALEALLVVDPHTQKSPFAALCAPPGRPSRKNLETLIARHEWLVGLPDPTTALSAVADAKVLLWANEAKRLNALELREYVTPRRHALLLATIRSARGQALDELTQMLLRLARKIEFKSQQHLAQWYQSRHAKTDLLIRTFRESLVVHGQELAAQEKLSRLESLLAAHGGRRALAQDCDAHLRHERQNWRPFARPVFAPLRPTLLRLVGLLPLQGPPATQGLLRLVKKVTEAYLENDYLSIEGVSPSTVSREWRPLVHDHPHDPQVFNRRQLEVVAVLELAAAIRSGEVFVQGSLSFVRFWDRLPCEAADSAAVAAYAASRGWSDGPDGLIRAVKRDLDQKAMFLDVAVGNGDRAYLRRGRHGRPVVARLRALGTPQTAIALEDQLMAQMPERAVLEAIANTEHWAKWGRHFGPPSRLSPQIKDTSHRYVFAAFAYGCGLGPTEAARHLDGAVSADQLAFADRRHVDIADLRAASADLVNLYARFELPQQWGSGASAAADGTHFETYEDNLLAEQHIRYGKTGGIAYRHVADNYIALFSRFIACGTYEATYILDALLENLSDTRPTRVHADTHGQSAAVFGLAYLLGIELMPRIRRWHKLTLYRSDAARALIASMGCSGAR